jgi:hypothetical protein
MPETDRSLVARARAGDAQAYTALLERHGGRLLRICVGSLGDPAAAADVAQDAALVAWLQLDRLQEPARFDDGTAVDARPSDALVLAVAAGIPIEIDPAVIAATRSGAPAEYAEDLARAADDGAARLAQELRADLTARAAEVERLQDQR